MARHRLRPGLVRTIDDFAQLVFRFLQGQVSAIVCSKIPDELAELYLARIPPARNHSIP